MKRLSLIIAGSFLFACYGGDTLSVISDAIDRENISSSKILVLYLSEGMCSDCINQELINLEQNSVIKNHIFIVGVFSNKNAMCSMLGDLDFGDRGICVDAKKMKYQQEYVPQYVVYDSDFKTFSNRFVPSACAPEGTMSYFEKIANELSLR